MTAGKAIIVSAPSGAGKTTIVHRLLATPTLRLAFSVSATNRRPRPLEINGKDYYFLSDTAFKEKIEKYEFAEYEEVYPGRFYGTLKSEIQRIWSSGDHVIFDVDVKGGVSLKARFGHDALAIFIAPPDLETLRKRLTSRGTESPEEIERRMARSSEEMGYQGKFDLVIVNNYLETAVAEAICAVTQFLQGTV